MPWPPFAGRIASRLKARKVRASFHEVVADIDVSIVHREVAPTASCACRDAGAGSATALRRLHSGGAPNRDGEPEFRSDLENDSENWRRGSECLRLSARMCDGLGDNHTMATFEGFIAKLFC